MIASNFTEEELNGDCAIFQQAVDELHARHGFDFTAMGLTAFAGAPLKWVYGAGATSERYKRIALSPGHGIGGIVIKSGKPMMFLDIDAQLDPREYSSYPIVFAEDLRCFCSLPLLKNGRVVGALLCAYRTVDSSHEAAFRNLIAALAGSFCGREVRSTDFLYSDESLEVLNATRENTPIPPRSSLSQVIKAQEDERRRISRELHDGIIQELLSISFLVKERRLISTDALEQKSLDEAMVKIDAIMDELRDLSVELRPSTLDHFGLLPALRSRAQVFEKTYGAHIVFIDKLVHKRFDSALETQLYRICQEAILNACKYSGSDTITVLLQEVNGWICATISDKGVGFNTEHPAIKGSGCGLAGMKERAAMIGATLEITSNTNGTEVNVAAPLMLEESE